MSVKSYCTRRRAAIVRIDGTVLLDYWDDRPVERVAIVVPDWFLSAVESRRDPAQAAVLQVGTPSLGSSHCVSISQAATTASRINHSGKFVSFVF